MIDLEYLAEMPRPRKPVCCADGMCGGCPRCGWKEDDEEDSGTG